MKLVSNFIFIFLLGLPLLAQANVTELFQEVQRIQKGPFGLNYLQGTRSRTTVRSGASPSGSFLFQAAYRNDSAQSLVSEFGVYTGNLFTTNYYELMGEFVYNNPQGSFSLDHQTLVASGQAAIEKANQMILHWVLEKYYVGHFPDSGITRGFNTRGIAGSEFEQEYATYFFNFYLSLIKNSYQYLPAYLLAKQSPIVNSSSLAESRQLIKDSYDFFAQSWGPSDSRVRGLYRLRNAIHNNLSENVLKMIEDYLSANSWYGRDGHTYLQRIHRMLTEYFNASPEDLVTIANNAGLVNLKVAAEHLITAGVNAESLFLLSEALVEAKQELTTNSIPWDKKAKALSGIASTCDYLNKETIKLGAIDSKTKGLTLLNMIFVEGLLIKDNWIYFYEEMNRTENESASSLMFDILDIASMTLDEVFGSNLTTWITASGESSMEQFRDDTLKSSSLNSVSVMLNQ